MKIFSLMKTLLWQKNVTQNKSDFLVLEKNEDFEKVGQKINDIVKNLYGGRSLRIRAVDAGSTNAEEIELTALNNAYYDIDRFGLSFVASPRHADILFVTGPVTRNLEQALKTTYEATPKPCIVVAIGDGACTGGIWKDSYAVVGAVDKVIPVHLKIQGDPPTPTEILQGVLKILRNIR
ncbi:MAG: hydrogenase-3, subunit G (HycG-like protein) [uncultured bacterium]|nr:MAG: hydrogenase-3, subunit G (HycG-like protein) [uncultured bacterium]